MLTKQDDSKTTNGDEVLSELFECHFPGSSKTQSVISTTDTGIPHSFIMSNRSSSFITEEKVKTAIKSFKPMKAAGPDDLKPIILQNLDSRSITELTIIYKVCLTLSYVPKDWCGSNVIFIPKPRKESYDNPKSYRPVSLTPFCLKNLKGRAQKISSTVIRTPPSSML